MIEFTREELEEIKKWAAVMGYQGTVKELEGALSLNRRIVRTCEAALVSLKQQQENQDRISETGAPIS